MGKQILSRTVYFKTAVQIVFDCRIVFNDTKLTYSRHEMSFLEPMLILPDSSSRATACTARLLDLSVFSV